MKISTVICIVYCIIIGNVVWLDGISAARALLGLSVQISDICPSHQESNKSSSLDQTKVDSKSDSDLSDVSEKHKLFLILN